MGDDVSGDGERPRVYYEADHGRIYLGDTLEVMREEIDDDSVNLIMTSPPFGLVREKDYGNPDADEYLDWFRPFAEEFRRVLKENGSLVIDIGGAWNQGTPTRSLYHFKLMIMLCEEFGFHLAQDFYWWNPSKLPTPAEWVTIRRVRVKDAVNCIWWLSPTPWPKADNRRVLQPYSESMEDLFKNGYEAKKRPSGHDISEKFGNDNGGAIPPNLMARANTESNTEYLRYCKDNDLDPHPARFPEDVPESFIRMVTDPGDVVFDPFAGSCVTGAVAERLEREWICVDVVEEYLEGALARFKGEMTTNGGSARDPADESNYYNIPRPGLLWDEIEVETLPEDGGQERVIRKAKVRKKESEAEDSNLDEFVESE